MDLIDRIEDLFDRHGSSLQQGRRQEPVTALQHALQCAQQAEWAQADATLVAAALVHDVGHFVEAPADSDAIDDVHEMRAVPFLAMGFGAAVIEPVRLHVQAKRYLVATDPHYLSQMTAASVHTLHLQGGRMCRDEVLLFEELPYAVEAVALRRWDDLAKQPRKKTPPLSYYLPLLRELLYGGPRQSQRLLVGALDI